jgi:hypothetical protein
MKLREEGTLIDKALQLVPSQTKHTYVVLNLGQIKNFNENWLTNSQSHLRLIDSIPVVNIW